MSILSSIRRDLTNRLDRLLTSNTGNAPVLLMLGGFKFSLRTAAPQEIAKRRGFRWQAQERFGNVDALQFTGYSEEVWNLPCVVFPDWQGITSTEEILDLAPENKPLKLISYDGSVLGQYVIIGIEETQTHHKPDGTARRLEFNITIRAFD